MNAADCKKNFSKFCSYEERKNKNWFHIPVLCGKCLSQISPHELSPYYLLPTCFKVKIASKESEIAVSGMHVWLHTIPCQTSMKHWLPGYDGKTHQSLQMRTKFRLKFRHKVLTFEENLQVVYHRDWVGRFCYIRLATSLEQSQQSKKTY